MAPPDADAVYEKAINLVRAQKGWLTRRGTDLLQACQDLADNPSKYTSTQVDEAFKLFKAKHTDLEEAIQAAIMADNVGEFERWEKDLDTAAGELSAGRDKVAGVMKNAAATLPPINQPLQQQAGGQQQAFRPPINETLKPFVLSLSHSPVEFRHWGEKLRSFFTSNDLANVDLREQQAYVRQFMDADLEVRTRIQIDDTMTIFGNDSVVSILEGEFAKRYPLFSRRLEYFRYSRQPGQAASNFVARLVQLSFEADLAQLTTDQLQVYRVLTGIKEDQLLGKLLDLKEMTFDAVQKKITQYEVNKASKASVSDKNGGSNTATTTRVNAVGGARPKQQSPSTSGSGGCLSPADLRGKCGCCGSPKHMKAACPSKDKATCTTCGKNGHWKSVCLRDWFNKQQQQSGGSQARAGKSSNSGTPASYARVAAVSNDDSYTQFQQE